jgi:hypothetical protein
MGLGGSVMGFDISDGIVSAEVLNIKNKMLEELNAQGFSGQSDTLVNLLMQAAYEAGHAKGYIQRHESLEVVYGHSL